MSTSPSLGLADHFAALDDPCVERTKLHPLLSIVVIASCAVISGAAQASRVRRTSGTTSRTSARSERHGLSASWTCRTAPVA